MVIELQVGMAGNWYAVKVRRGFAQSRRDDLNESTVLKAALWVGGVWWLFKLATHGRQSV